MIELDEEQSELTASLNLLFCTSRLQSMSFLASKVGHEQA